MADPPGRITTRQMQRRLIAAHALGLADTVGAERETFAMRRAVAIFRTPVRDRIVLTTSGEESQMPLVKLAAKRTVIRIVRVELPVGLNRRQVRPDRLRELPAPLLRKLR